MTQGEEKIISLRDYINANFEYGIGFRLDLYKVPHSRGTYVLNIVRTSNDEVILRIFSCKAVYSLDERFPKKFEYSLDERFPKKFEEIIAEIRKIKRFKPIKHDQAAENKFFGGKDILDLSYIREDFTF